MKPIGPIGPPPDKNRARRVQPPSPPASTGGTTLDNGEVPNREEGTPNQNNGNNAPANEKAQPGADENRGNKPPSSVIDIQA